MQTSSSKKYFGIFIMLVSAFILIYVLLTVYPLSLSIFTGNQGPDKKFLYDGFENGTYKLELGTRSPDGKWASMN